MMMKLKTSYIARVVCVALFAAAPLAGCSGDAAPAGTGMQGDVKRDADRTAMKLERVTAERDDFRAQNEALRKQNRELQDRLSAQRAPTTRR